MFNKIFSEKERISEYEKIKAICASRSAGKLSIDQMLSFNELVTSASTDAIMSLARSTDGIVSNAIALKLGAEIWEEALSKSFYLQRF
ncbi:hypothetical protein ACLOJK_008558 [Asimina triloba]